MRLLIYIVLTPAVLLADPWGKDACLVYWKPAPRACPAVIEESPFASFGETCIRFHQEVISPADGPRSHFKPSSSQYTREAMRRYGFYWGWILGCDRLMRENDEEWIYPTMETRQGTMKIDPVP